MFKQMISFVAVAVLVLALAPAANAGDILPGDPLVPDPGLGVGDTFRLVFISSAKMAGNNSDITVYNTFIDNLANGGGSLFAGKGWTWKVIGSTPSMNAITNTGTTGTGFPIYLAGGGAAPVAVDYIDLWDASTLRPIDRTETGAISTSDGIVWSGTISNGTSLGYYEMGWGSQVNVGHNINWAGGGWIGTGAVGSPHDPRPLYGMSEELTVIPEPSTLVLLAMMGGVAMLLIMRRRRVRK